MKILHTSNKKTNKCDLPNPWLTPEGRLGQLQTVAREWSAAMTLWRTLSEDEQSRLGGNLKNAYVKHGRTLGLWIKLHGVTPVRAILEVAWRIDLVSAGEYQRLKECFGEQGDDLDARIRCAKASHRLVLIESRYEIYFDGNLIPLEWRRLPTKWPFMKTLIRKAPTKRPVVRSDVNNDTLDLGYLSKLVSDLSCLVEFPTELADRIKPAGEGSCFLDMDADQICIIADR